MSNGHWDERFVGLARFIAMWSKDPSTKCGAIIANDNHKMLGTGYNGFAAGTSDSPERYADRGEKLSGIIHGEENAILDANVSLYGTSMYLTGFPCDSCTSKIIQVGISTVVVPYIKEDPFMYRNSADWAKSMQRASDQLEDARVAIHVLEPTGFDCRKLMGPNHPYIKEMR